MYEGILDYTLQETSLYTMPPAPVTIMMNVGTPEQAFSFSRLPNHGVGLVLQSRLSLNLPFSVVVPAGVCLVFSTPA